MPASSQPQSTLGPRIKRFQPQPTHLQQQQFSQLQQLQQPQNQFSARFNAPNIFQIQATPQASPQAFGINMQISPADSNVVNFQRAPPQQPPRLMHATSRQIRPQQGQPPQPQQLIRPQIGARGGAVRMRGARGGGVGRGNF